MLLPPPWNNCLPLSFSTKLAQGVAPTVFTMRFELPKQ